MRWLRWWRCEAGIGGWGRFWELWTYGSGVDLLKVSVPWQENPRINTGFVEGLRKDKGDSYVQQEFECRFVENGVQLMSMDLVDALVLPLHEGRR